MAMIIMLASIMMASMDISSSEDDMTTLLSTIMTIMIVMLITVIIMIIVVIMVIKLMMMVLSTIQVKMASIIIMLIVGVVYTMNCTCKYFAAEEVMIKRRRAKMVKLL